MENQIIQAIKNHDSEILIQYLLPYMRGFMKRYPFIPEDDIIGSGSLGLIRGLQKLPNNHPVPIGYLKKYIMGSIMIHVRKSFVVNVPNGGSSNRITHFPVIGKLRETASLSQLNIEEVKEECCKDDLEREIFDDLLSGEHISNIPGKNNIGTSKFYRILKNIRRRYRHDTR